MSGLAELMPQGVNKERMVIIIGSQLLRRKDFSADQYWGKRSWQIITSGARCEYIYGGKKCNKPATGITNFSYLGDEFIPHCSEGHHEGIKQGVSDDLIAKGVIPFFGRNGFFEDLDLS